MAIAQVEGPDVSVSLNDAMLRSYLQALHRMSEDYGVRDDISVSVLAQNSELFQIVRQDEDAEALWADVELAAGVRWTPFWPCALPKGSA